MSFLLVRPAGFEPVAYRVGVSRRSTRKALCHNASGDFCGSSQIVVYVPHRLSPTKSNPLPIQFQFMRNPLDNKGMEESKSQNYKKV